MLATVIILSVSTLCDPVPPAPGRESWSFMAELATPVKRDVRRFFRLSDRYGLGDTLETLRTDLVEFVRDDASLPELVLAKGEVEGRESYRVEVGDDGSVSLTAGDDDGLRRAVYWFEKRIEGGDEIRPCVRKPWLKSRITRCFFGPIKRPPFWRDELMDDVDYYPDAYLNRLAHEGVNGLWLTVEFRDLVGTSFSRPRDGWERRLAKLRRTAVKCNRYGIRTWIFAIEPHGVREDDVLFREHPELFVPKRSWSGEFVMCASSDLTRKYLSESLRNIFTAVPELGGLLHISHGERSTSCFSRFRELADDYRLPCGTCSGTEPWKLHWNVIGAMAAGMREVKPEAELISWFYQPYVLPQRGEWVAECAKHMPPGVTMLYNFESGGLKEQLGRFRTGGDYWQSYVGPSEAFRRVAASAQSAGTRFGAKIQVGNSHEDATVPFVPVPGLLYRKYREMRRLGCSSVLQCWYFGNYPGVMNEAAGELAFEDFSGDEERFLVRLARPLWREDAPAMARIWRQLSDAYYEYPFSNDMQYYGPFHAGVAWPLLADVEMRPLARTWKPEDPPSGDAIGECLENHTLDEALLLARRMVRRASACEDEISRLAAKCAGSRERELDLGVIRALQLQFRSAADIFSFYRDRSEAIVASRVRGDSAAACAAVRRMDVAVTSEIDVTRQMLKLAETDSRLGFHSEAEQHQFFPAKLAWRIGELEGTRTRLAEISAELSAGKTYPVSDFEASVPRYRLNGGWMDAKGLRFRVDADETGDLVVTVEASPSCRRFTLQTFDAAATLFPRQLHVTPKGQWVDTVWGNVVTPNLEADVVTERTADGWRARITISSLSWGRDPRLRPGWLRVLAGEPPHDNPVWPVMPRPPDRLNLEGESPRCFGLLVW